MEMVQLAAGGPLLSRIVWGLMRYLSWDLSPMEGAGLIETVMSLGITSFDHADIYGGYRVEEAFGKALAEARLSRDRYQIVSKADIRFTSDATPEVKTHHYDTTTEYLLGQARRSVRLLGCEYLDVLLIHRPDPLMNADSVAEAFRILSSEGTVRHLGVSNFTPAQFSLLQSRLDVPLVTNQVQLSLLASDTLLDGTLDQAQQLHRAPMIWSPLAGGRLFGEALPSALTEELRRIAAAHETSPDAIAYAWVLAHPSRAVPVAGTGRLDRIKSAVDSLSTELSRDEWFALLEAARGFDVP